jgi:glycosyltransferase involved in cell wall biosynthesis
LLNNKPWIDKLEFTYIGNFNEDFQFLNSTILPPLAGEELANELKKHHIYVTASINEPSGNHHIEAAQCGLPILYFNSGGIPEYCQNYGIAFDEDFEYRLEELIQEYDNFKAKIKNYKLNSEIMCDNFYALFLNLLKRHPEDREQIRVSLRGNFFILKNKFLKLFRDTIYFNFKAKLINLAKRAR